MKERSTGPSCVLQLLSRWHGMAILPPCNRVNHIFLALGIWLFVASVYALTSAGRLDMIDAQFKYAVTDSIARTGDIATADPVLRQWAKISYYPLGASIAGLPLAALGLNLSPASPDLAQFLWVMTNALLGGLIPAIMFLAWRHLGISIPASVSWALVTAFATLLWPTATSSFDQGQHALLLLISLLLVSLGVEKSKVSNLVYAGIFFGILINYQPSYGILILPILFCIIFLTQKELKDRISLSLIFCAGCSPFVLISAWFNFYRFGSVLQFVPDTEAPLFGDTITGVLVLLVSQGKGILFFSPLVLFALIGVRRFFCARSLLASLIISVSVVHLLFVASLAFPAGDWCWGPRYLVTTLPLWSLLLPYAASRMRKSILVAVIGISVAIQILGLSIDHQRYYFERNLQPFFWAENPNYHFKNSQLVSRFGEILARDTPAEFPAFSSSPYPLLTYSPFGPPAELVAQSDQWMRSFAVFYLPRPWPLWLQYISPEKRFLKIAPVCIFLVSTLFIGLLIIWRGVACRSVCDR